MKSASARNLTQINIGPASNGFSVIVTVLREKGRAPLGFPKLDLKAARLGGLFSGDPGGVSHNPPLWRRGYCEALGGILVEFLVQHLPMDAECFADLNATTTALV